MSIFDEIKDSYRNGNALHKLIYVNVAVFLALHIGVIFLVLLNKIDRTQSIYEILQYLAVPSDLGALSRKPWTIITYMFTHGLLYHIVFNLLILYWFGKYFIAEFGIKKLFGTYILGGLSGALLFVLFYNVFPFFKEVREQSIATGASASVMAIVIAVAIMVPNRRMNIVLLGPIKIIYVALVLFFTSTIFDFTDNTGGKISHIGGALMGYLFAHYYRRGKDITRGFDRFMDGFFSFFKREKKLKVTYKRPADDLEYNKQKAEEQKEIDRILDKISTGGYDSLSASEKKKLFNMKK
ncbi:MAG: rhomboid family intramembrane serine protease [Bacteroidales bacterium]|nr:rhomboid family intramembrane serine protease [Bacteroidales bacterium]